MEQWLEQNPDETEPAPEEAEDDSEDFSADNRQRADILKQNVQIAKVQAAQQQEQKDAEEKPKKEDDKNIKQQEMFNMLIGPYMTAAAASLIGFILTLLWWNLELFYGDLIQKGKDPVIPPLSKDFVLRFIPTDYLKYFIVFSCDALILLVIVLIIVVIYQIISYLGLL